MYVVFQLFGVGAKICVKNLVCELWFTKNIGHEADIKCVISQNRSTDLVQILLKCEGLIFQISVRNHKHYFVFPVV